MTIICTLQYNVQYVVYIPIIKIQFTWKSGNTGSTSSGVTFGLVG